MTATRSGEHQPAAATGEAARERLRHGRLMLLFTPGLVPGVEHAPGEETAAEIARALAVLEDCLSAVDVLQLRIKHDQQSPARALFDWSLRVADLLAGRAGLGIPLLVNDRVDVAAALSGRGVAGVHLGQDDFPADEARHLLGPDALIGCSTHDFAQVVLAGEQPIDYLGFGPIHPTATKGYERGLGAERAWLADSGSDLPLYPIGGITPANAGELDSVGRAAVSSAVLAARDPGGAARQLREALGTG